MNEKEYRISYIGGKHCFLLIKYDKDSPECDTRYPYLLRIDYKKGFGWNCSIKGRNINEMRHVIYDLYENNTTRCSHICNIISKKEGTYEGFIDTLNKRELISEEAVSTTLAGLRIRTKQRMQPPMEISGLRQIMTESGALNKGEFMRILLDPKTGIVRYIKPQKFSYIRSTDDSIYIADIDEPIDMTELKVMISMGIKAFESNRTIKLNYVFKD